MATFLRRKKRPTTRISSEYTKQNKVRLIHGGKEYFDTLWEMIKKAKTSIQFQTYIFDNDFTGRKTAAELIRAARRGVKVKLLLDGYASQSLPGKFVDTLIAGGVSFRWFEPLMRSRKFYFGRRLHHKVIVFDNTFSLVGGVNISDKYNDIGEEPAWLDWAMLSEGDVSAELAKVCIQMWQRANWHFKGRTIAPAIEPCKVPKETSMVRVRRNDWVSGKNDITRSYLEMMKNAKSHIIFVSSYFMPSRILRGFMKRALKRGVKISIIIAGKSDVGISKAAERYLYNWMFRHKLTIYEYKKGVLHGKISTYDGEFVTIGSYNINNLSAYASIELNLDVDDKEFALEVEKDFKKIMKNNCTEVIETEYRVKSNHLQQFGHWLAYNTIRFMLFLFTFYFKQNKD